MKYAAIAIVLAAGAIATPARAQQQPTYKRELPDSLVSAAKVTEAAAVATAQKRVPKGKIQSLELEREKGKLIYSFDMKVPGKSGVEEVNVDANTGKVLAVAHESAAAEKKEAATEAKEKKAAPKKP